MRAKGEGVADMRVRDSILVVDIMDVRERNGKEMG
jgi:hypothetical protein